MFVRIYKKTLSLLFGMFTQASTDVTFERRMVCINCPMVQWNEVFELWSCGKYLDPNKSRDTPIEKRTCGCDIEQKAKLKFFHCPQKKWENK